MRRKEVREDPNLVANGRFQAWWTLECSMFGGQWGKILLGDQWKVLMFGDLWIVPCLVVNGETSCLVVNGRF
jgi:hypothetical protein